jgi:hypothetical protein
MILAIPCGLNHFSRLFGDQRRPIDIDWHQTGQTVGDATEARADLLQLPKLENRPWAFLVQ